MYENFLKFVHVLQIIVNYYNRIHYFYYSVIFRGKDSFAEFELSGFNVAAWLATIFSIVICLSLIFIPLRQVSPGMRKDRKKIKWLAPIGILISPTPLIGWAIVQWYLIIRGFGRFVKKSIKSLK